MFSLTLSSVHCCSVRRAQELVRLPIAPLSCEAAPGFALLINSYTDRMEATMTAWFRAILAQVRACHKYGGNICVAEARASVVHSHRRGAMTTSLIC
jgi:hypothetical protein